jgi:L-threonylcarbamoyladenylate synthase
MVSMSEYILNCRAADFEGAANTLKIGKLVAFPTETVYGLGADACNADAIARLYSVKNRPKSHPLIVHLASMDTLSDWSKDVPDYAISLAKDFWPGPVTLILRRSELAKDFITGGQNTVGLRVPNHPVALGLLEAFIKEGGKGIAAPSANRFGNVSPTTAQAVADELGDYLSESDRVLDGGSCEIGVESTIIDCTKDVPTILRPGAITRKMISTSTGLDTRELLNDSDIKKEGAIRVSGSLETHYSPAATVVLDQSPVAGQGFIAMADVVTGEGVVRLAAPDSHEEYARILYSALRAADEQGLDKVFVEQPVGDGIAIAIRDRLKRASG